MLLSIALIFLLCLTLASIFEKLRLPRILAYLICGFILGPYMLNLLHSSLLIISSDLRKLALLIILLKAGLSLDLKDLYKIGRPAFLLSFLPASLEILGYFLFAPKLLGLSSVEALLLGSVLAAVSPAVVLPRMFDLMEKKRGTNKKIPQMLMAAASCDDIFVIILFSTFLLKAQGQSSALLSLFNLPLSIFFGLLLGALVAWLLSILFLHTNNNQKKTYLSNTLKLLVLLSFAFLLLASEDALKKILPMSGLLAVLSMAILLKSKLPTQLTVSLTEQLGKLWLPSEMLLFVLVASAVNPHYAFRAGFASLLLLLLSLCFRSFAVFLCLLGTSLSFKEKLFCILAYLPKATVQAAIGAVPLALGLASGNTILTLAVLSIFITAPIGAMGMDFLQQKLLD